MHPRTIRLQTIVISVVIASRSALAAPKVTVVPLPQGAQPMAAKTDAQGTMHVVFDSADGPQYVKSADGGKTLGKPLPLVDRQSRKPGLEFNTWDMAVTGDGAVHVVMGTNAWKLKLPKGEWGYEYTRLMPGDLSFSPLKNVNHQPSEGYSIAADERGTVTAVWMADKLFANVSRDGGATFGDKIEIDPSLNPCNCCTTSSAYGSDGRLAILYREETNNERDMYVALWDQTKNTVTKVRVGLTPWVVDSCPMTYYSIAASGDGYIAAWPTKGEIFFARLDGSGKARGPKEIKTPGANGMRTGLVALPAADGNAIVVWKKDGQLGWHLYDGRGKPSGSAGSARSAGNGIAGVVAKDGQVVLFR